MTVVYVRTWSLAILIAALAMLGPFSIDAYLPAFHAIGSEFGVPQIAVQQTLSVYLFAYAFMMLWHGALADALGRRPVVLASLAIYALATLGCAIAGNIETLWLFRALQGLCAGAGIVVGRAIIRDRFHGAEAQRLMSQITLVFGVAPAIAPVLGGVLLNVFGWRAVFWLLLALVIALLTWASKRLPETLPVSARQSLLPRHLWRNYVNVLRRPEFLLLGAIPALNFAAFFLYIASAPSFLMDLLGVSSYGFAWLFIPMITGVMIGAFISGRTAGMMTPRRTIGLGYILMFIGVATDIGVAALVPPGVPWHVLPIMIYAIGQQRHDALRDAIAARSFSDDARPGVVLAGFPAIRSGRRQCRNDRADTRRIPAFAGLGYGGLYGIEPSTVDYIPAPYPIARGCG